tara:strand:- start:15546 stop:15776 length:231 start_codon:yes stop_codon:yes gene_type:complete
MIIYVLDDGETYTLSEPTPLAVTTNQLNRIEGGEKVYNVLPNWDAQPDHLCNCMKCTKKRWDNYHLIKAQQLALEE